MNPLLEKLDEAHVARIALNDSHAGFQGETKMRSAILRLLLSTLLLGAACTAVTAQDSPKLVRTEGRYEFRDPHHADGIGKFFEGREIAHVMGHQAAAWLERPERETEERPDLLFPLLSLKPGMKVADIGAGTGYHVRTMARKIVPAGKAYAVEIQPEMLELLMAKTKSEGLTNVEPVLGTIEDPKLPAKSIDLVLMVDVYHEFSHPYEMMSRICDALKPGGRVVFVEFRAEDVRVPIKLLHKMTEAQIKREALLHPLEWITTHTNLPWQHVMEFRRK